MKEFLRQTWWVLLFVAVPVVIILLLGVVGPTRGYPHIAEEYGQRWTSVCGDDVESCVEVEGIQCKVAVWNVVEKNRGGDGYKCLDTFDVKTPKEPDLCLELLDRRGAHRWVECPRKDPYAGATCWVQDNKTNERFHIDCEEIPEQANVVKESRLPGFDCFKRNEETGGYKKELCSKY